MNIRTLMPILSALDPDTEVYVGARRDDDTIDYYECREIMIDGENDAPDISIIGTRLLPSEEPQTSTADSD